MKKVRIILVLLALMLVLFVGKGEDVKAAASNGVSVIVPTRMDVVFNEDGTTSVSEMYLENDSLVPVTLQNVNIKEFNNWEVVSKNKEILADTKQLALLLDQKELMAGSNPIYCEIAENTRYDFDVAFHRGAWTKSIVSEKALEIDLEYEIGTKEFALTLDGNGGEGTSVIYAENGSVVSLPVPTREGYDFAGWQDENGNLYTDTFTMPIGEVNLKAIWKELISYAIYITEDQSLRFIRTSESVTPGCVYKGMTVTDVFTGFDTATYYNKEQVPWWDGSWYNDRVMKKVIVEDVIQPTNIAYWFYYFYEIEYMDIRKLDTSKVTNMSNTFYMFGLKSPENMTILGLDTLNTSNVTNMEKTFFQAARHTTKFVIDLSKWDVSKVTNMYRMFYDTGYETTTFGLGDLSGWDTSNVTTMYEMFCCTGKNANWYLDCSGWNVSKVTSHPYFNSDVGDKVIPPKWVY